MENMTNGKETVDDEWFVEAAPALESKSLDRMDQSIYAPKNYGPNDIFTVVKSDVMSLEHKRTHVSSRAMFRLLYEKVGIFNTGKPDDRKICLLHPAFWKATLTIKNYVGEKLIERFASYRLPNGQKNSRYFVPYLNENHFALIEIGWTWTGRPSVIFHDNISNMWSLVQDYSLKKMAEMLLSCTDNLTIRYARPEEHILEQLYRSDCGILTLFSAEVLLGEEFMLHDLEEVKEKMHKLNDARKSYDDIVLDARKRFSEELEEIVQRDNYDIVNCIHSKKKEKQEKNGTKLRRLRSEDNLSFLSQQKVWQRLPQAKENTSDSQSIKEIVPLPKLEVFEGDEEMSDTDMYYEPEREGCPIYKSRELTRTIPVKMKGMVTYDVIGSEKFTSFDLNYNS